MSTRKSSSKPKKSASKKSSPRKKISSGGRKESGPVNRKKSAAGPKKAAKKTSKKADGKKKDFSDATAEIVKLVKAVAKKNKIEVDDLVALSGLSEASDPNEFMELEAALESAGIEVVDGSDLEEFEDTGAFRADRDPLQIYIEEIGRIPLINADREKVLGKRIQESMSELKAIQKEADLPAGEIMKYHPDHGPDNNDLPRVRGRNKRKLSALAVRLAKAEQTFAEAQRQLIEANLRLVVSIAKRYTNNGLHLLDLINEGNLGLIKAVERFDYKRGFKFSTYASWWIRQSIRRAIADQGRLIRVPVHMSDSINRWVKSSRNLAQKLGREPTPIEISEELGLTEHKLLEIMKVSQEPSSLDAPILSAQDSSLADLVEDTFSVSPYKAVLSLAFTDHLETMLTVLEEKEQKIIEMRFGLGNQSSHTLEEVGAFLGITRERVRQLEMRALKKLRHSRLAEELYSMLSEMGSN